jgi:hypothetical protein
MRSCYHILDTSYTMSTNLGESAISFENPPPYRHRVHLVLPRSCSKLILCVILEMREKGAVSGTWTLVFQLLNLHDKRLSLALMTLLGLMLASTLHIVSKRLPRFHWVKEEEFSKSFLLFS